MNQYEQYEQANAGHIIDGYFHRDRSEDLKISFERAKAEALGHLEKGLQNVKDLTFEQFRAAGYQRHLLRHPQHHE